MATKVKFTFVCTQCDTPHPQWTGQCKSCGEWNTLEQVQVTKSNASTSKPLTGFSAKKLSDISIVSLDRIETLDSEFDRVLGGGIMPGGIILLGGEPGIGKSTLLLQTALNVGRKTLYISGEESANQIKSRAERMSQQADQCYLLSENNLEVILHEATQVEPELLIIDSIQTVHHPSIDNSQGSVTQIRECTTLIQHFCKTKQIPCIIVGHITKEGSLAGPKILEHVVDTVLQFEGDKNYHYRILRAKKNRFGSTDEIGIFEMKSTGLEKVSDPSQVLLSQSHHDLSGSTLASTIHGMRPLILETQALVSGSAYGHPQRSSNGFDQKRLHMLLAVLEKRLGILFGQADVFLNIVGGIRCSDPALDLSVVAAIISSYRDMAIDRSIAFTGEVGLTGEIRPVSRLEERIKEAQRLGIKQLFIPASGSQSLISQYDELTLTPLHRLEELTEMLFS